MQELAFTWAFELGAGMLLTLGLVSQRALGPRFFLFHGLGAVGVVLLALALSGPLPGAVRAPALGVAIAGVLFALLGGRKPWPAALALLLAGTLSFAVWVGLASLWAGRHGGGLPLFLADTVLASLLLGTVMNAMWLGHWYLVQPTLSIMELRRMAWALAVCLAARLLLGLFVLGPRLSGAGEAWLFSGPGLFVLMRALWGIAGPLVLAFLVLSTVRIRSTQSATGLLYVMVLAVVTGELLSRYLALFHGIPG